MRILSSITHFCYLTLALTCSWVSAHSACESHLTEVQQFVLERAAKGDYLIVRLEGEVDGISRTVILMGESHVKGTRDAALGKRAVDRFGVVAVEGAEAFKEGLVGRMFGALYTAGYKAAQLFGLKPSTIKHAVERSKESPNELQLIRLEKGHKLSTKDKVKLLTFMGAQVPLLARAAFYLTATGYLTAGAAADGQYLYALAIPIGMLKLVGFIETIFYGAAQITGYQRFKDKLVESMIIDHRDTHMAGVIMDSLKSDPSLQKLLVIVGQAHVPGLWGRLEREQNFDRTWSQGSHYRILRGRVQLPAGTTHTGYLHVTANTEHASYSAKMGDKGEFKVEIPERDLAHGKWQLTLASDRWNGELAIDANSPTDDLVLEASEKLPKGL